MALPGVTEQQAKDGLKKQAIWEIYLPVPRQIPRPKFDVAVPNEVNQADLLFLPHDRVRRKTFRYVLTVVDVASRYKEAEPLTSKTAAEVGDDLPGVTEQQAKDWLKMQAIWEIYLPAPRHIPRPKFDVAVPNKVNQADLLFLQHDRVRRKTFRYVLTVVDGASRYKEAEPLTSKTAAEVGDGLARIYKRSPLRWPKLLQVDPGCELMGSVGQLLAKHSVQGRRGRVDIHRDQGIVERFNRTLAERLLGYQYAQEMRLPSGEGNRVSEAVALCCRTSEWSSDPAN